MTPTGGADRPPAHEPTGAQPCVLLVEDHVLLAQSLGVALRLHGCCVHTPVLTTGTALLADVAGVLPAVVLLDLDLGDGIGDGTALIPGMVATGAAVLVVSGTQDRARIATAVEAGAVGAVGKAERVELLVEVVLRAAAGGVVLDPARRHELLRDLRRRRRSEIDRLAPFAELTPREGAVLVALTEGLSVAEIAEREVVTEATVRTQVRGVLTKLGVTTQLAAVAMARRAGWVAATDR